MKRRTCILALILTMVLLVLQAVPVFAAQSSKPRPVAKAALLMDAATGKVLYQKNATAPMQPASLTKMMTALLTVEHLDLDKTVTVPAEAANIGGNSIALQEGERLTVRQLLNALLIYSANDTAVALGIAVSGDLNSFYDLMNARARELGMKDTHYISPNGLIESDEHVTTAKDTAILAQAVLENKTLAAIVRKSSYTVPATNKSGERKLQGTNKLLYDTKDKVTINGETRVLKYDGANGVKTGFMNAAGECVAASAKRGGTDFIAVVLNSDSELHRFSDAIQLLDYGFDNYYTCRLLKAGEETGRVRVRYGHHTFVQTEAAEGAYITLPKETERDLGDTEVVLDKDVRAPLKKGTVVGHINIMENGKKTGTAPVTASVSVRRGGPWTALYIADWVFYTICAVVLVLVILLLALSIRRRQRRRQQEMRRRRERVRRARAAAARRDDHRRRNWPYD